MKNSGLSRELSVILITKNRPYLLRRAVNYWVNIGIKLIIVDGSDESQSSYMSAYRGSNFCYVHERSAFPKRLKTASDLITTPYSIFISDDEFYIYTALLSCVNFLKENEDYVAVNGRALGFSPVSGQLNGIPVYHEWGGRLRVETDPKTRLIQHMSNYCNSLTVSVVKTNLWQIVANLYSEYEFPIFALWEIEMNIILSFSGKSKTLDMLMYLRSFGENEPIRNNIPSLTTTNDITKWWASPHYNSQRELFINLILLRLKNIHGGFSDDYYRNSITEAIDGYRDWIMSRQLLIPFGWIRYNITSHLHPAFKHSIKKLFFSFSRKQNCPKGMPIHEAAKLLEDDGVQIDYAGLKQIQDSILLFEKN
jgi:glycosyltransferase domain-containing protein